MSNLISIITPSIRPHFLDITQKCLENQTDQDFEWLVEIGLKNRGFTLPSDWNKLIRRANGDRIIMLQDCIKVPDNFVEEIRKLDHNIAYTFPVGKVKNWDDSPKWDWREIKQLVGKIDPHAWEIDFGSAPKSLFYDVGGFDEDFNNGWSWENVEIAYRAEKAGYKFELSQVVSGVALDHDAIEENPFRNKKANNDKRAEETRQRCNLGDWKMDFL